MNVHSPVPRVVFGVELVFVANAVQIVGLDTEKTMAWFGYGLNTSP